MSNVIQIKRGSKEPGNGTLLPYELGIVTHKGSAQERDCLYFGETYIDNNEEKPCVYPVRTQVSNSLHVFNSDNTQVQFFDTSEKDSGLEAGDKPDTNQRYIMRIDKAADKDHYTSLAIPIGDSSIYFKNAKIKWTKILDESNYGNYAVKLEGDSTITGGTLDCEGLLVHKVRLSTEMYGNTVPPNPEEGQLYFKLAEE